MKLDWDIVCGCVCCSVFAAAFTGAVWKHAELTRVEEKQARQWLVTLDQEKRSSGQPWQAEISATSYDRARATARERFSWADDTFSVSPVVENYLDVRQVRITP